ncbi:MAG: ferrous iron transporter B, partial [Sedimenticola sp.]
EQDAGTIGEAPPFNLWTRLGEAAATVPDNLAAIRDTLLDPLGLDVGDISSLENAAAAQAVNSGIFGAMAARFDGQAGAFAYLLFILLYFPCVATIGAIVREAGSAWALFVAAWTTGVAYTTSTIFYQAATFSRHSASSAAWIIGLSLFITAVIIGLRIWGSRDPQAQPATNKKATA